MKRTKQPNNNSKLLYPIEEEPIVLSKPLLDTFLSRPNPADLIALYCFYYYTAKWQKTNQPKATITYTAQGIKLGVNKIRALKKQLKELGLIEDIVARDERNRIIGHYIKVNFIWKDTTVKDQFHPNGFPQSGKLHTMENNKTNALSSNKENALSTNKKKDFQNFMKLFPDSWQNNPSLHCMLRDFIIHRKEIHKPLTSLAGKRLAIKLTKYDIETAITALNASIENSWTGVFPESINNKQVRNKSQAGSRRFKKDKIDYVDHDSKLD